MSACTRLCRPRSTVLEGQQQEAALVGGPEAEAKVRGRGARAVWCSCRSVLCLAFLHTALSSVSTRFLPRPQAAEAARTRKQLDQALTTLARATPSPPLPAAAAAVRTSAASSGGSPGDADLVPVTAAARGARGAGAAQRQLAAKLAGRLRGGGGGGCAPDAAAAVAAAAAGGGVGDCAYDSGDDLDYADEDGSDTFEPLSARASLASLALARGSAGSSGGAAWLGAGAREHLAKLARASLGAGSLAASGSLDGSAPPAAAALPEVDTP
jgi:hypothetical protein